MRLVEGLNMSNWVLAPICLAALVGFIGYAYYQGMKVSPDRNNTNTGPSQNDYPPGSF
jgi:hypothetical protein